MIVNAFTAKTDLLLSGCEPASVFAAVYRLLGMNRMMGFARKVGVTELFKVLLQGAGGRAVARLSKQRRGDRRAPPAGYSATGCLR